MRDDQRDRVSRLCRIARDFPSGNLSIQQLFESANPDLGDADELLALIRDNISSSPELVEQWQQFSWDNRGTPSHYMEGVEVGFYDAGSHDVVRHPDPSSACADFIYRKALWILQARRLRGID